MKGVTVIRQGVTLGMLLLVAVGLAGFAYERSEFMFLDEIEIGMQGIGKTVVVKDQISEFAIEVLGIIDQPGEFSDFIVVRVSGQAIGLAGGIAQGMSGSPVYVEGKLIGALSRAAAWSKEITPIGLVTPIEPMLGVIDASRDTAVAVDRSSVLTGISVVESLLPPDPSTVAASPDTVFAYPVATPILATGLSGRSLDVLMGGLDAAEAPAKWIGEFFGVEPLSHPFGLSRLNLTLLPLAGSGSGGLLDAEDLQAGSALGVALATGDVSIGALGTVTYRDGDNVVGFGHPFISNGLSEFPLTTVSIIDTMKAYDASFKLGELGTTVGTISQDRIPGVGGIVGREAGLIDLVMTVDDEDTAISDTFEVGLVDEPRLMAELLFSTGFEAIDSTLDRVGQGTVAVTFRIDGDGMPNPLERRDVFLSTRDIAIYPPWQLVGILSALQYNEFEDPEVTTIETTMEFTEALKAIRIEDLAIEYQAYTPGEQIKFLITLQTYQGEQIVKEGTLEIPADLVASYLLVRAYGGPRYLERGETAEVFQSLGDVIDALSEFPSYEVLTVELFAVDPYSAYSDALYGVSEATVTFPGIVVYGEREVSAILLEAAEGKESELNW